VASSESAAETISVAHQSTLTMHNPWPVFSSRGRPKPVSPTVVSR